MDGEIEVVVTVPETPASEETSVVETIVVATPEPTLPTLIELAQQIAVLQTQMVEVQQKTAVASLTAEIAEHTANVAIEAAIDAAEEVEEEIEPESEIPEIEEIPSEAIAEAMPEIEHREKRRSRFI